MSHESGDLGTALCFEHKQQLLAIVDSEQKNNIIILDFSSTMEGELNLEFKFPRIIDDRCEDFRGTYCVLLPSFHSEAISELTLPRVLRPSTI